MNDAMAPQIDSREWVCAAINKGLAAADCGEFIEHAPLKAMWQKKHSDAANNSRE